MKPRSATSAMLTTLSVVLLATSVRAAPFAYIPNRDTNVLSVIDSATNTVVTNVPIGRGAEGVAVNAQGTRVYVSNKLDANSVGGVCGQFEINCPNSARRWTAFQWIEELNRTRFAG